MGELKGRKRADFVCDKPCRNGKLYETRTWGFSDSQCVLVLSAYAYQRGVSLVEAHLPSPFAAKQRPSGALLPGAARAVGIDGEKRLRRDPAARSRSAAQAEEAGWKLLWGREGAKPLGPLYAASAAITRQRALPARAETRGGSGRAARSTRPRRGDVLAVGALSYAAAMVKLASTVSSSLSSSSTVSTPLIGCPVACSISLRRCRCLACMKPAKSSDRSFAGSMRWDSR